MESRPGTINGKNRGRDKMYRGRVKWIALGAAVAVAGIAYVAVKTPQWRREHAAAYPMPPWEFFAQADSVRMGMLRDEVLTLIRDYDVLADTEEGHLYFALLPFEPESALTGSKRVWISIQFDKSGRVKRVRKGDG